MKYGQNISGHICQGHVDTVGIVNKITKSDKSIIFDISIDKKFQKDLICLLYTSPSPRDY